MKQPPEPQIAIVVSPREWAERLHRFVADHGGARVRAMVLDAREALDGQYAVLVAEDLTSFLTPRLVEGLRGRGRRILGVYDPAEPWGRERLLELGVDDTIESDAPSEAFLQSITLLAATGSLDDELDGLSDAVAEPPRPATEEPRRHGRIAVVGGPSGGVGATEIAIALASALHEQDGSTAIVDADDLVPSVAQRLSLPLHPNLRTAVDAVEQRVGTLDDALLRVTTARGRSLRVLCGLANPRDRAAVRPHELTALLSELTDRHSHVVVNIGHLMAGGNPDGSSRGTARTSIAAADVVVGVCAPTPVGVTRLLEWVADVRSVDLDPEIHVVVNRAPNSSFKRAEIEAELVRNLPAPVWFLPDDRRVAEAAWDGVPVPPGPFTKAVAQLAGGVLSRTPVPTFASWGGART